MCSIHSAAGEPPWPGWLGIETAKSFARRSWKGSQRPAPPAPCRKSTGVPAPPSSRCTGVPRTTISRRAGAISRLYREPPGTTTAACARSRHRLAGKTETELAEPLVRGVADHEVLRPGVEVAQAALQHARVVERAAAGEAEGARRDVQRRLGRQHGGAPQLGVLAGGEAPAVAHRRPRGLVQLDRQRAGGAQPQLRLADEALERRARRQGRRPRTA